MAFSRARAPLFLEEKKDQMIAVALLVFRVDLSAVWTVT